MSFLAPLYIAGILAVSLPILFHLIRRTPHGRQTFSSLMFLAPSPPRLTRKSRLNNILLLILRATALALLAFAFARPLFYQEADMSVSEIAGRRVALLVDTSASMRRGDLWPQAVARVDKALGELEPNDELALYTFDQQVRPLLSFDEWNEQARAGRAALARSRLATASPTWAATNLGDALATVADAVTDDGSQSSGPAARRQVILISDLAQGSRIEALQGYEWPSGVLLDVQSVTGKDPTNAALALVEGGGEEESADQNRLRVRVSNDPDSASEQFSLAWANGQGPLATAEPVKAYVPPGQSRIVRVPWPAAGGQADRLVLTGDAHDFDNTLYLIPPRQETVRVVFVGDDAAGDAKGLLYYLQSALADTHRRKTDLVSRGGSQPLVGADLLEARLVVVSSVLSDEQAELLRKYAEEGGAVLFAIKDVTQGQSLAKLLGRDSLELDEASGRNFALIARVQFDHPLFAPFSEPRFADFTKVHFWKHRRVKLDDAPSSRILAWFDNGDPFLIEQSVGKGRLLVATSGWQPDDSQLALSTKFVPLVAGMIPNTATSIAQTQQTVLDKIDLPPAKDGDDRRVRRPDGSESPILAAATSYDAADEPGIYHFSISREESPLAVNLAGDESRTAPLPVEELEQRGARVGTQPTVEQIAERQRQLRLTELENRQKLWRWLIVAVLAVLLIETALAGSLAHRTVNQQVPA